MHNLIIISNSKFKAAISAKNILNKYAILISHNTWSLKISDTGLKVLSNELKAKSSKYTSLCFFKKNIPILTIGNFNNSQNKFPIKNKFIKPSFESSYLNLIAELHDIGKASLQFQNMIKGSFENYFIRHEYLSVLIIEWIMSSNNLDPSLFNEFLKTRLFNPNFILVENELLYNMCYILGTHHKLPEYKGSISNNSYIHNIENIPTILDSNTQLLLSTYQLKKLKNMIVSFLDLYSFDKIKNKSTSLKLRNIHVLADHIGSSIILKRKKTPSNQQILGKKNSEGKFYSQTQTLKEHTSLVKYSTLFSSDIFNKKIQPFNSYNQFSLTSIINERTSNDKYSWQDTSIDFVKDHLNNKIPTFTILSSSTGSGKTRFGLKLNALISSTNRLTVVQGLRSLTLQTGSAYEELDFFEKEDINVQIGSDAVVDLYEMNNSDNYLESPAMLKQSNPYTLYSKEFGTYLQNNKINDFLNTPVLISTIDYLIKSTDWTRNSNIAPLLRLITSDLIIDEVDNFDINDLKSINSLMYLCGLYSVNVTLSTATAIPALVESLTASYESGLNDSNISDYNLFYLSDFHNNIRNKNVSILDFINNCSSENIKHTSLKNIVEIKDIDIKDMLTEIVNLHNLNHETDSHNNNYSAGLVRIAHIKNCLNLAIELENSSNNDISIDIVMYHSSYPLIERSFIEKQLDDNLTRKSEFIYNKPFFKNKKKKKNNILIVIATPVEEVGRDHDFDWAIIEPSSSRSITQTAGRVFRHRERNSINTNIVVMNKNFAILNNKNKPYSRPGFENNNKFISSKGDNYLRSFINPSEIRYLVTNKNIILINKDLQELAYYENEEIEKQLKSMVDLYASSDFYKGILVNNIHFQDIGFFNIFREGGINKLYFLEEDNIKGISFKPYQEYDALNIKVFESEYQFNKELFINFDKYIDKHKDTYCKTDYNRKYFEFSLRETKDRFKLFKQQGIYLR